MKKFITILVIIFPLAIAGSDILSLIEDLPVPASSQPTPLCQLTILELKNLIQQNSGSQKYVLVKTNSGSDDEQQFVSGLRMSTENLGYKICTVPSGDSDSLLPYNVTIILEPGRLIPYHGRRDPSTLVRFLANLEHRISQIPYQTIENKMDKKAYEHILEPKIVAYFPDLTAPGFAEFQSAARQLAPNPPFFVIHNPQLAAKFHLFQPGQMSLVRRLEKSRIFFPNNTTGGVAAAPEIVDWIQKNRGLILHELKDTNLYDPEIHDPNKYLFVAIGDKQSPLGLYFFKILTKTIQNISRENEIKLNPSLNFFDDEDEQQSSPAANNNPESTENPKVELTRLDDIEIVWIDTQLFPTAPLNIKNKHHIDGVKNVWFGAIQAPPNSTSMGGGIQSTWMDLNSLELTRSDRTVDEANIGYLRYWILAVADRWTGPEPGTKTSETENPDANTRKQTFSMEPEPVSPRQGGNFLLECQVSDRIGRCGWLKDGEPVAVGGNGNPYRYVSPENGDDCSLTVNGADKVRDSGEWSCYVTDEAGQLEQQNGAIISKSVTVRVRPGSKAEL